MEKPSVHINTYRDVVQNTHNLIAEANRIHEINRSKNMVAKVGVLSEYEKKVLHNRKMDNHEHDELVSIPEVLDLLGKQYRDRLYMHLSNTQLKSEGVFDKAIVKGLIENSVIRRWSNRVQFDEMKDIVDELLDKEKD